MSVKLRRGISAFVVRPRGRMLKLGGDHLASSDRRFVSTASGLYVTLEYFQSLLDTFSMGDSHAVVVANQGGKRNRFRRAEGRIPTGSMLTRRDLFTVVVH